MGSQRNGKMRILNNFFFVSSLIYFLEQIIQSYYTTFKLYLKKKIYCRPN